MGSLSVWLNYFISFSLHKSSVIHLRKQQAYNRFGLQCLSVEHLSSNIGYCNCSCMSSSNSTSLQSQRFNNPFLAIAELTSSSITAFIDNFEYDLKSISSVGTSPKLIPPTLESDLWNLIQFASCYYIFFVALLEAITLSSLVVSANTNIRLATISLPM